jgi:hypothetical protein
MAYTNPRSLAIDDIGEPLRTLAQCTLADYTVAGTTTPAVGDIVTNSTTGNWYVARAPDNDTSFLGKVVKIEKAPTGTAIGQLVIEWLDVVRFLKLDTDDLSTVTLGNAAIKDGDTSVANNFDAGASTGNLKVWAKSGTSGAGTILAALVAA